MQFSVGMRVLVDTCDVWKPQKQGTITRIAKNNSSLAYNLVEVEYSVFYFFRRRRWFKEYSVLAFAPPCGK